MNMILIYTQVQQQYYAVRLSVWGNRTSGHSLRTTLAHKWVLIKVFPAFIFKPFQSFYPFIPQNDILSYPSSSARTAPFIVGVYSVAAATTAQVWNQKEKLNFVYVTCFNF